MSPRTADGVVLARADRFAELSAISAADMGERREMLGAECRWCGCKRLVRTTSPRKRQVIRCANEKCKKPWRRWFVYGSGGGRGSRRSRPAKADRLDAYVDLGLKMRGLTLWEERVLVAYAETVNLQGRRTAVTLSYCKGRWPRRRGSWSRAILRELLDRGRAKVKKNLEKRGIFD